MKTGTLLTAALLVASLPMFAQQQPPDPAQSGAPAANPASPQSAQPGNVPETLAPPPEAQPPSSPEAQPAAPGSARPDAATPAPDSAATAQPVTLMPVSGELVSKLDSRTAKTGDDFVIETKSSVKTSEGTEIPKGSKLVGHVVAVQPSSGQTTNSQVAVNIDHAQLKGGQSIPIRSEIQSLGSAESASDSSSYGDSAASRPPAQPSSPGGSSSGAMGSSNPGQASSGASPATSAPGYAPGYTPGTTASSSPTPGTIVARNGHIAIRTTSMPGILLANNAPGEQDPRMTQASGILLGAKKDVQLESGTKVVVGVSAAGPASDAAPSGSAAGQSPGAAQ